MVETEIERKRVCERPRDREKERDNEIDRGKKWVRRLRK